MLVVKGRCRHCRAVIPVRYPLVELVTRLLFFGFFLWLGPALEAVKYCVFSAIQVALVAMDLEERILADEFTLGGIVIGMVFAGSCRCRLAFFHILAPSAWSELDDFGPESAFAAGLLSFMLWLIGTLYQKIRSREGLGFGDVKMVGMIGAF